MARDAAIALALHELDSRLAEIGGCSDGYCIVVKPQGMHTNGGCRCSTDNHRMQRFAYAYTAFRAAVYRANGKD